MHVCRPSWPALDPAGTQEELPLLPRIHVMQLANQHTRLCSQLTGSLVIFGRGGVVLWQKCGWREWRRAQLARGRCTGRRGICP